MSRIISLAAGAACALALVSQPVAAQSVRSIESAGRADTRGMASLTIPLGGAQRTTASSPRVDFTMESSRIGHDRFASDLRMDHRWNDRVNVRRSTLSLTLDHRPTLMLNAKPLATFGPQLGADEGEGKGEGGGGIGVGGGIAIGLAALGGLVLVAALEVSDDLNDLADPD